MSNFKNNPKYPIEPSSNEPFVPYFLRSSREATEPLGGRDYVIFPDSFPLIGMPLTGNEQLMVQGKLEEPEIMTPNQIKEFFSGSVVQDSQGFVTGDQVYKELLKYVPITRKINGYTLDKDINLTKADVGLGNVDNTPDLDKPVSNATQQALDDLEAKHDAEFTRLQDKDKDLQNQINDLGTTGEELAQEFQEHLVDPNAHPEIVDQTMSDTSAKAISNKIVKAYIDTIIGRQGSKSSVVANDQILVLGTDGKYYRATIQKAVLDLVDSAIGDMGKVAHFIGEASNSAQIPNINEHKDGAFFYVSKLATPNTTITDAITSQEFESCDVAMKDGSQWRVIGKTMWWVNLNYTYNEAGKKAIITNTAGNGFEIPLATSSVNGLYPKEHFKDVSEATATPTAGKIAKYNESGKLNSSNTGDKPGEVLIYEQIQQILDLAKEGFNYSILDTSNPIYATYVQGSTGTGRPLTPYWNYGVGLTFACGGDNNALLLNQSSQMTGTTNSIKGTVILTGDLVNRIKLTNKLYYSMDFNTLANEQASVKIQIKNGKTGAVIGETTLAAADINGVISDEIDITSTTLDPSSNNFLTIEITFTPSAKMPDVDVPGTSTTKPADWSVNKVDKLCISVEPIDDPSLNVVTQSELSRIQPILTHIANANVHVTKQDKDTWDAKATEDFVLQKIQDLIGDAPDVLDTLGELAEALKNNPDIIDNILNDLTAIRTDYIPRSGGAGHAMTGNLYVPQTWNLMQSTGDGIILNKPNELHIGKAGDTTYIRSGNTDIMHNRAGTNYKIWDASNLPNPVQTTDLAKYLPLAGGKMTGNVSFPVDKGIVGYDVPGTAAYTILGTIASGNNTRVGVGTINFPLHLRSTAEDIIHVRGSSNYKVWDAYNLANPLEKTTADGLYYPLAGKGYFGFDTAGRPVVPNNQGYAVKDNSGNVREFLWMDPSNNLNIGNTSKWSLAKIIFRASSIQNSTGKEFYHEGNLPAYPTWATLSGKPTFATVATSGDYNDLNNKPTIPSIPGGLPNPYALTFTGYQSKTYNGSAAVSVAIPSKVSELTRDVDFAIRASDNNLIAHDNEFNFANKTQTSIAINYRNGLGTQDGTAIASYSFYNGTGGTLSGIIAGLIQARSGLQIGATADFGWYYSGDGGRIAAGINTAKGVNVKDLLVSDSWADYTKVPSLGIYSKGAIQSNSNILAGGYVKGNKLVFSERVLWTDTLAPDKNFNALLQVLDHSGSSTPTTYGTVLQINSRVGHWATQLYIDQTNATTAGKLRYRTTPYNSNTYTPFKVVATEDFVLQKIQDLIGDAPDVLDTLGELAEALKNNPDIIDNILNDLTAIRTDYIPRSGGAGHAMTGNLYVPQTWNLMQSTGDGIILNKPNELHIGKAGDTTYIRSGNTDIMHNRAGTNYKIWDASNLPNPVQTTDLAKYLPLAGGKMTGNVSFPVDKGIVGYDVPGTAAYTILGTIASGNNTRVGVGTINFPLHLRSTAEDIIHVRGSSNYKVWDAYNLANPLEKTTADGLYYPLAGKGYFGFDTAGRPVVPNNQGYAVKDNSGNVREFLWMDPSNNLNIGNTSKWSLAKIIFRASSIQNSTGKEFYHEGNLPAYPTWATLSGKPTFATVATSGSYNDLTNKPTIPTVPTKVSQLENDSKYVKSTSTLRVNDIQVATADGGAAGVLYIILES